MIQKLLANATFPLSSYFENGSAAEDSIGWTLYVTHYKKLPFIKTFRNFDSAEFEKRYHKNVLTAKYDGQHKTLIYHFDSAKIFAIVRTRMVYPDDDWTENTKSLSTSLDVFFPNHKSIAFIESYAKTHKLSTDKKKLGLILLEYKEITVKYMDIDNPKVDFKLHYNEDFLAAHKTIVEKLNNKSKGIVLLHGLPGTGKTTYLRWLVNNMDKKFIYLPPDLSNVLAEPNFLSFLINYPNSVLIIEDAENVLLNRELNQGNAVSNILNLSDGLLSDILNIQIIATYNVKDKQLDSALFRKGRLICDYSFKQLTSDRVNALCKKIKTKPLNKPATLSEIYYKDEKDFTHLGEREGVGFKTK